MGRLFRRWAALALVAALALWWWLLLGSLLAAL